MVSARPEAHVTLPDSDSGPIPEAARRPALSGRPSQPPATEDVRVDVRHLLPGIRAAVEDGAVAGAIDALGDRGLVRETGHFLEQAAAGLGDGREVNVMFFRYDQ